MLTNFQVRFVYDKKLLLIPATILASVAFAGCDLKEWSESGTYPLDLRNEYKQYNPETKKMEWVKRQWRMDIPRAYVLDTRGRNGVPAIKAAGRSAVEIPLRIPLYKNLTKILA